MYGAPGNGKTTLIRSITGSTSAPVIYWQITEHTGSYSVQEVFNTVARMAPAILVIEDIDSMPEHTRSSFLNTLDGASIGPACLLSERQTIPKRLTPRSSIVLAAFDSTYEIPSPSSEVRRCYMKKVDRKGLLNNEQLEDVAKKTAGLSISQLNELYMSVAIGFHYDGKIEYDRRIRDCRNSISARQKVVGNKTVNWILKKSRCTCLKHVHLLFL